MRSNNALLLLYHRSLLQAMAQGSVPRAAHISRRCACDFDGGGVTLPCNIPETLFSIVSSHHFGKQILKFIEFQRHKSTIAHSAWQDNGYCSSATLLVGEE